MNGQIGPAAVAGRIALLTSSMDGGGAQRAVMKLAGGIAARGRDVDLVLGRAGGHYSSQVPEGVRVVDLHAPRMAASVPALVRYLRRERPVAMLSALDYVNVIAVFAHRRARVATRLLVSERNTLSFAVRNGSRLRTRLRPHLVARLYPRASGVIAVSAGVADDLARITGIDRGRIEVIGNPIVTPQLRAMAAERAEHPWLASRSVPVILGVGRLSPQKDFGSLIRAFGRVRAERAARLIILGEGSERERLEAIASDLGLDADIDLPGWIPNPYPSMAAADVFVLSSRWEGLPGVLIEALYCGARVVSTDCPSGPREILDGERHGALVPVGDITAIAAAIERALAGAVPAPAPASWHPYREEVVVDRYLDALVGV